jgi:hypothetical protein
MISEGTKMVSKRPVDPQLYTTDYVRSDFDNMSFLGNPHLDALTTALQAIGAEVWTSRRRLYVIEALMEKNIPVTQASIQAYMPTKEEEQIWKADRDRMISGIYAPFLRAAEVSFPSAQTQSYDPHKEPSIARREPLGVGKLSSEPSAPPSPSANIAGPMTPAR